MEALEEYGGYVADVAVSSAIHKTAEDTAETVANAAPRRTGKYAESITSGKSKRRGKKYTETVYADAPHYRLTHLLERPHATRNGGRTKAQPHWATGSKDIIDLFVRHLKEELT